MLLSTLIVESTSVSITTSLLSELVKKKIKVIFCDEKRNPVSELVGYYGSHDTSNKVRKQIQWSSEIKEAVWTQIVAEKIRKQKELLEYLDKEEAKLLFGMKFTRSSDSAINAALDYGYSIILSAFSREITANGYITQLGLSHDNMFNQFNLASVLMEPYRILIDREVYNMKLEKFEHEEKMQIVNVLNQEVKIDDKRQYVNNAVKIYCKSVFDALDENDISKLRFYSFEL